MKFSTQYSRPKSKPTENGSPTYWTYKRETDITNNTVTCVRDKEYNRYEEIQAETDCLTPGDIYGKYGLKEGITIANGAKNTFYADVSDFSDNSIDLMNDLDAMSVRLERIENYYKTMKLNQETKKEPDVIQGKIPGLESEGNK